MVGVVLFTDPGDDGITTDENGVEQYPEGAATKPYQCTERKHSVFELCSW